MKKVPTRSGEAQAALGRRAPTMDHRNEPRGGTTNESRDLLGEAELDEKFDPPTRAQLEGDCAGVALADNGNPDHGPYIVFRTRCGADGYHCVASFRDDVAFGGGATRREAMQSLAAGLRAIADKIDTICG